ncbi:LacI family DNA-binding transcriptional regulator [Nitratireductor sp. ZSWI3]|uniref:LacI family DNA-binding transcriptional regulator n=1 Tax=Nitratireductor sp. ZSWI3 TaxID=2966359 RepID=UPI00214F6372|nr:LacI family DNA-binding transcriptional regulator [Nitratireductor sp. ZSWI3]MCR4265821.1 LacI family DNA-binding transcriptional regulator [Nitratireductor sp. ZSWI3]
MTEQTERPVKKRRKGKGKTSVTLDDVAAHAGVSRSTASLVVRDSKLIPKQTHKRVRASMQALGYVYNQSAANLRTQKTRTLGMVIADISNPFYAVLASGIENECGDKKFMTIFADTAESVEQESRIISRLIEHNVAGAFLCPSGENSAKNLEALEKAGIPVVLIMRYLEDISASYVGPDNHLGLRMLVDHLAGKGHRDIAYIGGPPRKSSSRERYEGFLSAMKRNDLEVKDSNLRASAISRAAAMSEALELLQREDRPSAIICYNDVMAFGVMLAMLKCGLTPGKEVAVVGFDNIPESSLWTPSLTTVSIDAQNIGRLAAAELLARISDPDRQRQRIIVQPTLIARESS